MTADVRDAALFATCPCMPVPRYGELPAMDLGQRVLVACNGVFLELRRSWLRCLIQIATMPSAPPVPYGRLSECIAFTFGVIPVALLERFIEEGRVRLPNEVAGGLIYSRRTNTLRLQLHESIDAGPCAVRYRMPTLGPEEELAVDLHTHGQLAAFWSSTDDADDQGVKVCGVFGELHRRHPNAAFRLAVNGHFKALPHPWIDRSVADDEGVDPFASCPTLASMGFTGISDPWNT